MRLLRSANPSCSQVPAIPRKRCGHLISLTPLVVSDSSGMRATFQHGFHHLLPVAGRGALALRFSPKRSKRLWLQSNSVPILLTIGCSKAQWVLQPHWRDLHDQATRLDFVNWWSAQCIYSMFPFTSFSHFPFSLNPAALGLHTPMKAHKSFNTDSFSKWYFSNINVHTKSLRTWLNYRF